VLKNLYLATFQTMMLNLLIASASLPAAAACECDAALSFPDTNCANLVNQGYDCSGCTLCVQGFDSSSWQTFAWTTSMNLIRGLFNADGITWDQDIAADVYDYVTNNQHGPTSDYPGWNVEHSCVLYGFDDAAHCSYARPPPYGPAGENIHSFYSTGAPCNFVPDIAMDWASENLNCNNAPCTDTKGVVGHFTAMVWKGAKTFGCGTSKEGVTMCRFKGDDTEDCTTPNEDVAGQDCHADNVDDWKWFTFDATLCSSSSNATLV